ncbi:MAG: chloride channel protein [Firmicutes bacterium]|nr:chloride channel protein [Bacillota bacterium]
MIRKIIDNYREILYHTFLAALIGIVVGIIDTIFGLGLLKVSEIRDNYIFVFVPLLPLAGVIIILLYRKFSNHSLKGMSLIFETCHGNNEKIPKMLIPLVMVSTWLTHLFGGSAGRESVAVQLGGAISHNIGRKLKLSDNSRVLMIAGMAAGFAGLFQTPLAATFFAMEVMVAGSLVYEALLPALVGSYVASFTSHYLGLEKFSFVVKDSLDINSSTIFKLVIIGIIFGIVGGGFAHILDSSKRFFAKILVNPLRRIFIMGVGLSILLLVLGLGRYTGLGTNLISASFNGDSINFYDWFFKFSLTILTLSAGYQGGEVTPLFAIGATLGVVLASLLGLPPVLIGALGYAAVFGSATNTLLAPILIGVEVFGANNTLLFVIVCSLAYVFNGNRSIYKAQKSYSYLDSIDN